jgi:hypothetical protein
VRAERDPQLLPHHQPVLLVLLLVLLRLPLFLQG